MSLSDNTTRSLQLVAGSSSTIFESPNKFTYRLPASGFKTGSDEVALKSLSLYYSWANISAEKGNNSFSYIWQGATFPVVLSTGIWSFAEIYSYLTQVMTQNGHYLVDNNGQRVFYITLLVNPTLYCLSLIVTPLPAALPPAWTNPAGVVLGVAGPQLVIPAGFDTVTGFAAATYPAAPQATVYQLNSGVPQITDVSSINIICNLVDNSGFSLSPNILTNFVVPSGQLPGSLVTVQPNNLDWVPIQPQQTFTTITVEFVDQLRRPLIIRDTAGFVAVLSMRRRR